MSIRIGINGFGRIGRSVLRIVADRPDIEVAVINDLYDNDHLAYLLQYDTVMGVFEKPVSTDADSMTVAGRRIAMTSEKDPARIPWARHGVEIVVESTGRLLKRADLEKRDSALSRFADKYRHRLPCDVRSPAERVRDWFRARPA